jgi:fumarate reductase iron-sulfur subunit
LQESKDFLEVEVWRGDATGGRLVIYQVPRQPSQTILDVVTWIQREAEPGLSYRFSCRVGMCGSCAMMVNGIPRWTCRTHVEKVVQNNRLTIEPMRNMPVIKDLACNMDEFFDKWKSAEGQFRGRKSRQDAVEPLLPESPKRLAASAAIECINCAICYASCDVVSWNPAYLGPAALNRAWSLVNDERDTAQQSRLQAIASDAGCHNCHSHQNCTTYCPNELNPTASIAGLKRLTARAVLAGKV